jgi:hypothetical protein
MNVENFGEEKVKILMGNRWIGGYLPAKDLDFSAVTKTALGT